MLRMPSALFVGAFISGPHRAAAARSTSASRSLEAGLEA
jgi:hypothetical protein